MAAQTEVNYAETDYKGVFKSASELQFNLLCSLSEAAWNGSACHQNVLEQNPVDLQMQHISKAYLQKLISKCNIFQAVPLSSTSAV